MFNNPFREEAAASRNQRQQLDHLLRVTAPHERIVLAGIGVVLLAVALWTFLGSIERSLVLDGFLISPGVRHDIVANEHGHLVEILVAPGDQVETGVAVARQSVPALERETETLRDRVDLLETELAEAGGNRSGMQTLLAEARVALLQMEARQAAKESIVSPAAGEIMTLRYVAGEFVRGGATVAQLRTGNDGTLTGVLRVAQPLAGTIRPGMQAEIEVVTPGGEKRRLDGQVSDVSRGPLPSWLAELPPQVAGSHSRIDLDLDGAATLAVPDGVPCRVRILIGRQPPAALFDLVQT